MTAAQILVVDDESDIRDLLKEILAEEGYEVRAAANAAQARSLRSAASPDLVLLDIWMPDTDGITLLREWSDSGTLEFPVIKGNPGSVTLIIKNIASVPERVFTWQVKE